MRARYVGYSQRVLELDPIAYPPLGERSGTVAYDLVSGRIAGAQNGTHTSVVLGADGMGDGLTATTYDGAASYTDMYSAAFIAAFDGAAGSVALWAQVSGAGVWTDGTQSVCVRFLADGNNYLQIVKSTANGTLRWDYNAGGTLEQVSLGSLSTLDWMHLALTWSAADDEMIAYYNGAQTGSTQTGLGVWAGALIATDTIIGAGNTTPADVWSGQLAHCAMWDRALSAAEIADLAVVE